MTRPVLVTLALLIGLAPDLWAQVHAEAVAAATPLVDAAAQGTTTTLATDEPAYRLVCVDNNAGKKFFGMFFSGAGADTEGIEARLINPAHDVLTVVQDYKDDLDLSMASIRAAHSRGNVVHLNLMPSQPAWDPAFGQRIGAFATALATEMKATAVPGIFITIGPEMNGPWTETYGCIEVDGTPIPRNGEFVDLHRRTVAALRAAFTAQGVDQNRLRIVWGPNVTPNGDHPCSYDLYWPGWNHVDLVGYSQYSFNRRPPDYRYVSPQEIVATASDILAATGTDPSSIVAHGRVVILQTGMEHDPRYDRGAWWIGLVQAVQTDPRMAGLILFHEPFYGHEPYLRWLTVGDLQPLDGWDALYSEIHDGSIFETSAHFPFCPHLLSLKHGDAAPRSALTGQRVELRCDYGERLDCISATVGSQTCQYERFDGTAAVFGCTTSTTGSLAAQCRTFAGTADRCPATTTSVGTVRVASQPSFGLHAGRTSSRAVEPTEAINVRCDYGEVLDCIAPSSSAFATCSFQGFDDTAALFSCPTRAMWNAPVSCRTFTGTPDACPSTTRSIGQIDVGALRPRILHVFPWQDSLVIKGHRFGAPGRTVAVRITYKNAAGQMVVHRSTRTVAREDMDAVYVPLAALPGFSTELAYSTMIEK